MIKPYLKLLRPHQWLKNSFIFTGILFGHAWNNNVLLFSALFTFIAFSCVASAIYIFNDFIDCHADRLHPTKKNRPLAANTANPLVAGSLGIILGGVGLDIGFLTSLSVGYILIAYVALNVAYTYQLKKIFMLDVVVIACGFLLRVLAGTYGIGIPPSDWLLTCTLLLTLFLGFSKRYAELLLIEQHSITPSSSHYSSKKQSILNIIRITAIGSVATYVLYIMDGHRFLIYTVPFVFIGVFRYLYLLNTKLDTGLDIARDLLCDSPILAALFFWIISIIYFTLKMQ